MKIVVVVIKAIDDDYQPRLEYLPPSRYRLDIQFLNYPHANLHANSHFDIQVVQKVQTSMENNTSARLGSARLGSARLGSALK